MTTKVKTQDVVTSLRTKLHPKNFTAMSNRMAAYVECLIGDGKYEWVEPGIVALCLTSDGFFMTQRMGHIGFDHFEGATSDLERNLRNLAVVAELTKPETEYLFSRLDSFRS